MKKIIIEENIYTYHIDFAGHVSNIIYIQWMEIGRLKLLERVGMPVQEVVERLGLFPTLINTEIRYRKQLFLGDKVRIEVWLSKLKNVSAIMEFRFYNGKGELTADGRQTGLFIDSVSHQPKALDSRVRDGFMPYLASEHETS
ncbi:MAG: acyl-CoA thioesterase [Proteobacteria bacterium]|nr:acyl-CoA thioesterase [Pseudomonadota bacterium]MBU1138778.1 acyl-CoA thioesterase [Pseudomonadota bacterium]MBU1232025.1 acyl-CoA thioesterase [Pseudomonadota bacterium]MBU1418061.1 acyl-CoA thioesterase [Pseudomonadota bacterium]MBU1454097.1 acyl-CoA thioesterase [Pseudomonadota bacterium]